MAQCYDNMPILCYSFLRLSDLRYYSVNSCRKYKQLLSGVIPYYKKVAKQRLQTTSLLSIIL